MSVSIDGFRIYKKTELSEEFETTLPPTDRAYDILRTMEPGEYGISAYKNTGAFSYMESRVKYFKVKPFYKVIYESSTTTDTEVTVYWSTETNLNHINGYYIYKLTLQDGNRVYTEVAQIDKELTSYTFTRDEDVVYTYVISPVTYEGFHDADSDEIRVLTVEIPPVTLLEPDEEKSYGLNWDYNTIVLPANTFRFQWENPIDNPETDGRFTLTQVDDRTWDYTILDEYLNSEGLFALKFTDLNNKVSLIAVGDISGITDMAAMFYSCSSLTTIPLFDTSNVTDMYDMFGYCSSLINVPLFDTQNVTEMYNMFDSCTKVESGALALYQQASATGKVTMYGNAFRNCGIDTETGLAELQQIPESWGGLKVELPANTFRFQWENPIDNPATDARFTLTQVDDRTWDYTVLDEYVNSGGLFASKFTDLNNKVSLIAVGNIIGITNMNAMFSGCASLTTVPLFDTSNVTNMTAMFNNCTSLTSVPLFDTSNVTNMTAMFNNCTSLTSVPLFDTSNVISMYSMFSICYSLTSVPLFDTSNATNMTAMFNSCTLLTTVPLFDTSNVTLMDGMFYDCTQVESGALALYQQVSATGKVTLYGNTFTNCGKDTETGLAELQQIPQSWGGLADDTTEK